MSATTTNLKEAIVNRRSIRKVAKNDAITKDRIEEVLKQLYTHQHLSICKVVVWLY